MIKRIDRILAISGTFLALVVLLTGCATVQKEADPKESLRSAASTYWKMRMEGNFEETFKMEDEETLVKANKEAVPLSEYYKVRARIGPSAVFSALKDVRILGDKGMVDVEFAFYLPQISKPYPQILTDEWIFKNGKWRHIFRPK